MWKTLALLLCVLLTVMSPLGATSRAETADAATGAKAPVYYSHDGRVTLIDGTCVETPIGSIESAAEVVFSVLDQLGGDERTDLEPWRELTDAFGNHYFVFQQIPVRILRMD